MWLQEPGSFTKIMAAMVAPRNTSNETMRSRRDALVACWAFDEGVTMVCGVAMVNPPMAGIVQQAKECRNAASLLKPALSQKKYGRESNPRPQLLWQRGCRGCGKKA